ncbi:hypothetical protein O9992_26385 [Vibrio lentus]|nr:hypothetical protein [Vibrio lentus]
MINNIGALLGNNISLMLILPLLISTLVSFFQLFWQTSSLIFIDHFVRWALHDQLTQIGIYCFYVSRLGGIPWSFCGGLA